MWCVDVDLEIFCGLEVSFDDVVEVGGTEVVVALDLAPPRCS
jgi:hypothetical protein